MLVLAPIAMLISGSLNEQPAFPERFHGVWDASGKACQAEVSDMRVQITERNMAYWESDGEPKQIDRYENNELIVTLAMSGEEQKWPSKIRFVMSKDDNLMFAEKLPIAGEAYHQVMWFYHRCGNNAKMGW